MDKRIKLVLDSEYKNDPLYPFYLTYFEKYKWDNNLKDFIKV